MPLVCYVFKCARRGRQQSGAKCDDAFRLRRRRGRWAVPATIKVAQTTHQHLLPTTAHGMLQPGRRHRRWRAGHGDASGGVDDGDGVAAPGSRGLMKLHARVLSLEARGNEGGRGGVEREAGCNGLWLLSRRGFGRVAGEGRALRSTGDGNQVALSQKTRAELEVVLQVKGAASLKLGAESIHGSGFGKVFETASPTDLPLGVLGN